MEYVEKIKVPVIYKEKMWNMLKTSNQKIQNKNIKKELKKIKEHLNNTYTIIM